MKKQLFLTVVICLQFGLFNLTIAAQVSDSSRPVNRFYGQAAAGVAFRKGGVTELGIQGVHKNKWSATLSYHRLNLTPANQPGNYQAGSGTAFFIIPTGEEEARVKVKLFSLTAGKVFKTGYKGWCTIEGGVSRSSGHKVRYQYQSVTYTDPFLVLLGTTGSSSNYKFSYEKKSGTGAMIRTDFNWALNKDIGLGVGMFASINPVQSAGGLSLKILFGSLGQ